MKTTSFRYDDELAAEVTRALKANLLVPDEQIKVTVSKGRVTLEGDVRWEFQRKEAERTVRRIKGVRGVTNAIVIRPRIQPSPAEMKKKIEDALVRSAETDAQRIQVEVQGDTVILTGTVRSWAERYEAERVAWSAPGVGKVNNQIRVTH